MSERHLHISMAYVLELRRLYGMFYCWQCPSKSSFSFKVRRAPGEARFALNPFFLDRLRYP